jgi:two-component system alkaline phosphatase synthesis response regulator PhoP
MPIIYFVEDDKAISYVIEKTIEHASLKGKGFQDGTSFMKAYQQEKPDLILLDLMLPDMSGIDILKWIRKQDKETPVMVVSALQSEMDKVIALDHGADDYMTKPFGVLELTSRIQAKLRKYSDDKKYVMGNVVLDDKKHTLEVNDEAVYITNKEYDIIKLLLKHQKDVVSKEAIFKDVWDTDYIGETRTLDMHIKSLRQKLEEHAANIKITTVRGVGYQLQ